MDVYNMKSNDYKLKCQIIPFALETNWTNAINNVLISKVLMRGIWLRVKQTNQTVPLWFQFYLSVFNTLHSYELSIFSFDY